MTRGRMAAMAVAADLTAAACGGGLAGVLADGQSLRTGAPLSELFEVVDVTAGDGIITATVEPRTSRTIVDLFMTRDAPIVAG